MTFLLTVPAALWMLRTADAAATAPVAMTVPVPLGLLTDSGRMGLLAMKGCTSAWLAVGRSSGLYDTWGGG